jgi:hypothetical protein
MLPSKSQKRHSYGSFKIAISTLITSCLIVYMTLLLRWQHLQKIQQADNTPNRIRHIIRPETFESSNASCKNSFQGRHLISDSRGYTCTRGDIHHTNGCCKHSINDAAKKKIGQAKKIESDDILYKEDANHKSITPLKQFECRNCNLQVGCCQEYEYCISCCLKPDHLRYNYNSYLSIPILQRKVSSNSNKLKNLDYFDYCQFVCRTSSLSVQTENSYRGSHNYCYSRVQAPVEKIPVNSDWTGFIRPKI